MIAALAIFSVSCSKSDSASDSNDSNASNATEQVAEGDAKSQLIALCNDGVSRIKANPADAEKIMNEVNEKGTKIMDGLSQNEQQALAQDADLNAAMQAFLQAAQEAMMATNGNNEGDDNTGNNEGEDNNANAGEVAVAEVSEAAVVAE